jgi:hypothetical protein
LIVSFIQLGLSQLTSSQKGEEMKYPDFKIRFNLAVHDFKNNRPVKDEFSAMAAATKQGLCNDGCFPPRVVAHQIILSSLRPDMQQDAAEVAHLGLIPRWKRFFIRM